MFKRLINWLSPKQEVDPRLKNARYALMSSGPRGTKTQLVLVESQDGCGPVQRVQSKYEAVSRQTWLDLNGHSDPKVTGRAWLVNHLPDECVFL